MAAGKPSSCERRFHNEGEDFLGVLAAESEKIFRFLAKDLTGFRDVP